MTKLLVEARGPREDGTMLYLFFCPGCECTHRFDVGGPAGVHPRWSFNGNLEKPTFSPSLLYPHSPGRCHLFMENGRIRFLADCDHKLKGQTVDCPDFE